MDDKEYEMSFSRGIAFLEDKNYKKAQKLLAECYLEKKNFRTNFFLFQACYGQSDFKEASRLADEYLIEYLSDNKKFESLILAKMMAGDVIGTHKLYLQVKKYMNTAEKNHFFGLIKKEESKIELEKMQELKKSLLYCGAFSKIRQRKILQKSYNLPLDDFKETAQKLLCDENVHQFVKVSILDDLRQLNDNREAPYLFIDGKLYKIKPSGLHVFEETKLFSSLKQQIISEQNDNNDLLRWNEIKLKLSLLYPFEEKIIGNSQKWKGLLMLENIRNYSIEEQDLARKLEELLVEWSG
ncbi:hypothetical protein [Liquorilactobacillus mali]|uniref:TPR repeat-containing protein n=1 Tax=Liquorilactobacillus mali KCTC 3596 = DSM 20444 TaxID=1046596 RepID=J1F2D5_9LACO|nr:hypothetical protein [Liquorilactobacillus mali]EJE99064.1 hypothetical protein LMA_06551 [Liquorilactobacillus mali KCTC 3596 = DSM 20444]KRN10665.1 hypothetical protein FD00_GL002205 [Liquorilactobacillus mali KCTC 3596 = DSM 20444]MDC7951997.1 hypothetical protein [Liquorilactobacillus mali]QFQ74908.1 hypothetical protein LM596_07160 [Liquorilactobacillus mali]